LCFLASMFRYWGGTIHVKVHFMSSPLIRGRFGVALIPPGVPIPVSFPTNGQYRTFVFDTAGSQIFEFDVPFDYEVPHILNGFITNTATTTGAYRLMIGPITPFQANGATAVNPTINVIYSGGHDFHLAVPDLSNVGQTFIWDEGCNEGEGAVANVATFSENVVSLMELAKRYSCAFTVVWGASVKNTLRFPTDCMSPYVPLSSFPGSAVVKVGQSAWTFAQYVRQPYWGYTGGARWKMLAVGNPITTEVVTETTELLAISGDYDNSGTAGFEPIYFGSTGLVVSSYQHRFASEWECPDRNNTAFKYAKQQNNGFVHPLIYNSSQQSMNFLNSGLVIGAAGFQPQFFYAGADDYHVGGWIAAPCLRGLA